MDQSPPPAKHALPPLTWLRAFEASARHLSFTIAAKELNLTQSAISQHVRNLEAFLGRDLFLRKTRALELTEDGSNYVPILREAFHLLASGTQAFTGGDRGQRLVLQCNLAFSVFWLAPRLHRLYQEHPWLVLNIVTPIWDPEKHATNASLEIRFGRPDDMSRSAERLCQDRFYPVCAPDYQDSQYDHTTARLFDCAGMTGSWNTWLSTYTGQPQSDVTVNLASTYVIAMQAARHGAGMTLSHDTLAKDLIANGTLICPFDHKLKLTEAYFLLAPSAFAETPATRTFREWLLLEMARFNEEQGT
ncbi:MAG: LysR family transcriptional regulator [Paracoccaceae bacterium]|nr:LysR family transcriptional regulator [Paracoccaceae bacterium]